MIGNVGLPTHNTLPAPVTADETAWDAFCWVFSVVGESEGVTMQRALDKEYPSSQVLHDFSEVHVRQLEGQS